MTDSKDDHGVSLDDPMLVPLREVIAALTVAASVKRLLLDPGVGPTLLVALQGRSLGARGQNHELPATDLLLPAPAVVDIESARLYMESLGERLRTRKPHGGFEPDPEPPTS